MEEKYIQLFTRQIEKLDTEDFDLEAWKSSTIVLLKKVFGAQDPKIEQIEKLKIDYSSWTLRDSNAKYKPIETCKQIGKEILLSAIDEIELLGVNDNKTALKAFFSEGQLDKLKSKDQKIEEKKAIIRQLKKNELESIVLSLFEENYSSSK